MSRKFTDMKKADLIDALQMLLQKTKDELAMELQEKKPNEKVLALLRRHIAYQEEQLKQLGRR